MKKIMFSLLLVPFIQACSIAPYTSEKSAKTLGKNNYEVATGGGTPFLYLSISRGLSENLDASLIFEAQMELIYSISMKYAIQQSDEGMSYGVTGGLFVTQAHNSSGFYLGPIMSYKNKKYEFYSHVKYNRVNLKGSSSVDDDNYAFEHDLREDESFGYFLGVVGTNLQFAKHWLVNINAKYLFGIDKTSDGEPVVPGVSLIYRF
jgi:hypothetical protein